MRNTALNIHWILSKSWVTLLGRVMHYKDVEDLGNEHGAAVVTSHKFLFIITLFGKGRCTEEG